MISDFHNLSEKVDELAAMTLALRQENAALRLSSAALGAENAALQSSSAALDAEYAALRLSSAALAVEHAALCLSSAALAAENADLLQRVSDAYDRVSSLLGTIPSTEPDREAQHDPA